MKIGPPHGLQSEILFRELTGAKRNSAKTERGIFFPSFLSFCPSKSRWKEEGESNREGSNEKRTHLLLNSDIISDTAYAVMHVNRYQTHARAEFVLSLKQLFF